MINVVNDEVRISQATKLGYIVAEDGDGVNLSFPTSKTRRGRVIKQKSEELGTISLDKANLEKVKIIANQDVTVLKKQSEKKKEYKSNVVLNTLKLPIYKGDVIGKLIVKDDLGNMIEEVKITVSEDLKKDNYFNIFMKILKGMITGDLF